MHLRQRNPSIISLLLRNQYSFRYRSRFSISYSLVDYSVCPLHHLQSRSITRYNQSETVFNKHESFQIVISQVTNELIKKMALSHENHKIVCLHYQGYESAPANSNFPARAKLAKDFCLWLRDKSDKFNLQYRALLQGLIHLWSLLMTPACKEVVTMVQRSGQ